MKQLLMAALVLAGGVAGGAVFTGSAVFSQQPADASNSGPASADPPKKPDTVDLAKIVRDLENSASDSPDTPTVETLDANGIRRRIAELKASLEKAGPAEAPAIKRQLAEFETILARDGENARYYRVSGGATEHTPWEMGTGIYSTFNGRMGPGAAESYKLLETKEGVLMVDSRSGDTWVLSRQDTGLRWIALPRVTTPTDRVVVLPSFDSYRLRDPRFMEKLVERGGVDGAKADADRTARQMEALKGEWERLRDAQEKLEDNFRRIIEGK
jgi:hypothetical protein